jgi:hypothetical protein
MTVSMKAVRLGFGREGVRTELREASEALVAGKWLTRGLKCLNFQKCLVIPVKLVVIDKVESTMDWPPFGRMHYLSGHRNRYFRV